MRIFNGGHIDFINVPVLPEEEFRRTVMDLCQNDGRLVNFFGLLEGEGNVRLMAIIGFDEDAIFEIFSMIVTAVHPEFPSLTPELLQAHNFEREIAEQFAIVPCGHPWLKPLRYHANYRGVADLWQDIGSRPIPGTYPFFSVAGEEVHEVGVGPVHAGIIEPGHFRFVCHGEEILHLEIQLGYQHRGIEPMMTKNNLDQCSLLSEAIAGDTSIGHSMAYCEVMEALSGTAIPPRSQAIRGVALELERLANHVGDLGALSLDAGFLPASAYCGRMRGDYLNLLLALTGNRFGKGLCRPGGVLFDMDEDMIKDFCRKLTIYKKEFESVSDLLFTRPSVLARFEGLGVITSDEAKKYGLVGPAGRASQLERDVRIDYATGLWQFNHIPISLGATGDVFARAWVRRQEVMRSLEFLLKILPTLPHGNIFTPLAPLKADGLAIVLVEGWRGEIMHVGITDHQGQLRRYKIKDPSFHNWFGLAQCMRNQEISDFPLCNKSFNLSYCGHDL
ncbi:MAG: NADH-quinone oxidoreductase subunit C [Candidatus Omnitrophica bacterium]|nr:NADH-quinone oxidoreductase subunit C [Candidatus Omnitrophota bacterium]